MSHAKVRKIFAAALAEYAALKGLKVSYDNVKEKFDDNDEDHIKSHLIPADTFTDTLGGDHKAFIGMFQMTIVTKYGTGYLLTEEIIEELQNVFKVYKDFLEDENDPINSFRVQVTSPIKNPEGKQNASQWVVPAYFEYRADTN